MKWSLEVVIFFLLLIDSIGANIVAWPGNNWYKHHFRLMSRYFPAAKGWTTYYLILVLWMGYLLLRFGAFG